MWHLLMVVSLAAIAGAYSTMDTPVHASVGVQNGANLHLVESMATYRKAVLDYYLQDPNPVPHSAPYSQLLQGGYLPSWFSALTPHPATFPWDNYRDASGVIYIYSRAPLPPDLYTDLMQATYNSALIGFYRSGSGNLESPQTIYGNLPIPQQVAIHAQPDTPVWVSTAAMMSMGS